MNGRQIAYLSIGYTAAVALLNMLVPAVGFAQQFNRSIEDGAEAARGDDQAANLFGASGIFTTITNVLLFLVGVISVIMIVIGGLRYVLSGGNSSSVTAAKNTVLYAIVGLIIAILAYAIVNFVIGSFVPGGAGDGTNV